MSGSFFRFFDFFVVENLYFKLIKKNPCFFFINFKKTDCYYVARTLPDTSPKTASKNIENCKSFSDLSDVHFDENAN